MQPEDSRSNLAALATVGLFARAPQGAESRPSAAQCSRLRRTELAMLRRAELAMHAGSLDVASLVAGLRSGSAGAQEQPRSQELAAAELSRLMKNSAERQAVVARAGAIEPPWLHNLGSNPLLVVLALLMYVVCSWRTARPTARAKQVRRPEKEAADRRRRRQVGAAAQATQGEAQVETNRVRTDCGVEAAKHKAAKAEAATKKAAAEKAAAAVKALAASVAVKAKRAAAAEKAAEAAKATVAVKAAAKAATKAAAEKAAVEAAKAAAATVALDRPSSLVMSLAAAQFDTGRQAVPESTIGGQTTCIICFVNPKSHAAVPCGHQCACGECAAQMRECPVCRNPALQWMQVRVA